VKFKAELNALKLMFADVARFTSGAGLSSLASVHVEVAGKSATFTGFDGETGACATVAVSDTADGAALLPKPLVDYVAALSDGPVVLEVTGNEAKVSAGRLSAKFRVEDASHYPAVSFLDAEPATLAAADLRAGLKQARIAAAGPTSNRTALTGVLFEVADGELRLVATDSYRLAMAQIPSSPFEDGIRRTIPIRAINELERLLGRVEKVEVRLSETAATFTVADVLLTTRLIGHEFPNYAPIIPSAPPTAFTVSAAAVSESVKRLKIVAPKENRALKVSAADGVVTLSAASAAGDAVVEPIEATLVGAPPDFAVNIDYFAEAVATLGTEDVTVSVTDAVKPLLLTSASNPSAKHVVMPVRV
jgi:DNA polymerase III subunit beta